MSRGKIILIFTVAVILTFRFCCGIFVVQPIKAIPNGKTIVYWRLGMDMPFVSSVDGILEDKGIGVSLLGRAIGLGKLAEPIMEKEIVSFGYSESLYLWSTGGKSYEK